MRSVQSNSLALRIYFDKALPNTVKKFSILANMTRAGQNIVIEGNRFAHTRMRGILFQGRNALITGNTTYNSAGSGIVIESSLDDWFEGNFPRNIRIVSNRSINDASSEQARDRHFSSIMVEMRTSNTYRHLQNFKIGDSIEISGNLIKTPYHDRNIDLIGLGSSRRVNNNKIEN